MVPPSDGHLCYLNVAYGWPGIEPVPPTLAGGFLSTTPPAKSPTGLYYMIENLLLITIILLCLCMFVYV